MQMKSKTELKKIAKKIAKIEKKIMNSSNEEYKKKMENNLINLVDQYKLNVFDMVALDEMIQDMLQ